MITRIPFESYMRAASVQMLTDYAQDASIRLQVYKARPRTINPPCAFLERLRETIAWTPGLRNRTVQADIRIVWGLFDSGEAAAQRDQFVDEFIDWTSDRPHAAFATTVLEPRLIEDDPNFVPDWVPPEQQNTYYATTITLEGFAGGY